MRNSTSRTIFKGFNYTFMVLLSISILLPFISLASTSFLPTGIIALSKQSLDPKIWTFINYRMILNNKYIWKSYGNTIFRTVIGTPASVIMTSIPAYCLSKKWFPHRNFWTAVMVFTMFFSGGLIPTYLLISSLHLVDNRLVLILPSLIGTYNMIIIRNFFQQLPVEIEESGRMDGAGNLRILFSLIYPISMPVLATVALWVAIGHWNAWFDCLVYIRDTDKYVLQVVLRRIILEGSSKMMEMGVDQDILANPEGLRAAAIFVATIPILCSYPFVQKYFVHGIIVGSLKG